MTLYFIESNENVLVKDGRLLPVVYTDYFVALERARSLTQDCERIGTGRYFTVVETESA